MKADRFNSRARASSRRGAVSRLRAACACAAALVLVGGAAPAALGHSHQSAEVERLSIEQLKRFYLWCARAATDGQLDNGAIMQCSVFYEALKERAFGGDFERLLAWSRENSGAGARADAALGAGTGTGTGTGAGVSTNRDTLR